MTEQEFDGCVSEGGVCSELPSDRNPRYAIAPSVDKRFTTVRPFRPTACWRIDDHRFDFDSSFIMPTSSTEFALLAQKRPPGPPAPPGTGPYIHAVQSGEWLDGIAKHYGFASWMDLYNADENAAFRAKHPDPNKLYPGDEIVIPGKTGSDPTEPQEDPNGLRLTVFGHADPTGKEDYNQILAGRRAKAVYAVLVRDIETWDDLYCQSFGGDEWSMLHNQLMLAAVGFDPGGADGKPGPHTAAATKAFQAANSLGQSGYFDPPTRKKLFRAYMDVLCVNAKGEPFQYNRKDFLSRGECKDGKADYQSCGEFNPLVVFSQEEEAKYKNAQSNAQRDTDNAPNRRVVIYMFPSNQKSPKEKWPCPAVKEGSGKCKAQFWLDADVRRNPQADRREYLRRGKTFACKWYNLLVQDSPCEGVKQTLQIWLQDHERQRMSGAAFRVTVGAQVRTGIATQDSGDGQSGGLAIISDIMLESTCLVEWGPACGAGGTAEAQYVYRRELYTNVESDSDESTDYKLHNLNYMQPTRPERQAAFDKNYPPEKVASEHPVGAVHRLGTNSMSG